MLKHLTTITLRNILGNKASFFINLLSLTSGLVGVLFILLWVNDELQKDKFHANDDQLFQAMTQWDYEDRISTTDFTHGPLAALLMEEVPEVEYATNIIHWFDRFNLMVEEETFSTSGYYVGPAFFKVFDFKLKVGEASEVLRDPNAMVISESTAKKFFGSTEKALGKTIQLEGQEDFFVSGIFEDVPAQSTLQFEFLMSYEKFIQNPRNADRDTWNGVGPYTMLTLSKDADQSLVLQKIHDAIQSKFEEPIDFTTLFRPYSDGYLYGVYENGKVVGGRITYVRMFSIIGLFLLLISCINFMNLSTAKATKRVKEVGVKKTLGADRVSLVIQYLMESTFLAFLSLILALGATKKQIIRQFLNETFITVSIASVIALFTSFLSLPMLNQWFDKDIPTYILGQPQTLIFLAGVVLITGIVAGLFPGLFLSKFRPISVLSNQLKLNREIPRQILITIQLAIGIGLIAGALLLNRQFRYLINRDLGFDKDQVMVINASPDISNKAAAFRQDLDKLPGIKSVAFCQAAMPDGTFGTSVIPQGSEEELSVQWYRIDSAYLKTYGIKLVSGRPLGQSSDRTNNAVLVNETFLEQLGWSSGLGKAIRFPNDEERLSIVGVVKDFH